MKNISKAEAVLANVDNKIGRFHCPLMSCISSCVDDPIQLLRIFLAKKRDVRR